MKKVTLITILFLLVASVACTNGGADAPQATVEVTSPLETATATPEIAAPTTEADPAEQPVAGSCPEATADTYLLRVPQHGFCLLYPVSHKVERPNPQEVILVVGGLLNAGDPRVMINVTPASGRTVEDAVGEIVASFQGIGITQSETTVAGEPAVVLDDVPGQDINRRVIFAHDDQIYHLYFSPVDPENSAPIDEFAQGILDSFTFIPVSETVTAADECIEPKADQQLITSDEFGYCFLAPVDFTYEQSSDANANLFVGSMMDVEHPKLMIEVTDADGRTVAAAADELVASFEGFDIPRTFGDTLGYQPAERLDGVPGQDLGRVLMVVNGDRLFRLTFVPADPDQANVYAQMEELFDLVLKSFRFLP